MTAKHRKGKSNHKHEDNFFKNEAADSEARGGGNGTILALVLFALMVVGGAIGAWFCFQQHQTLTHLSDNIMGMQMKIVKLQSSHEAMRQSSDKLHISESLENRLNTLEESYALAQKQVGMALATAEQLKTSDLPAQVLSLHTEMKTRLADMQQATVSLEQLGQLQAVLKAKSEEFEGVRVQVEGLVASSAELSQQVASLTGSLGEAESKLEERAGQVVTLSAALDGQAAEVLGLKEQLGTYQAQLEASTQEMAAVRELLESEQSQRLQQAGVEEQLSTVRQSLQDQSSAAHSLQSELGAQLEDIQKQVGQMVGEAPPPAETVEQPEAEAAPEEEAAAAPEEEQEAANVEKEAEPEEAASEAEAATEDEAPAVAEEEAAPADEAEAEGDAAPTEEEKQTVEEEKVDEEEVLEDAHAVEVVSEGEQALEEEAAAVEEQQEEEVVEAAEEEKKTTAEEEVTETEGEEEQQDAAAEEESHGDDEPAEWEDEEEPFDVDAALED